MKHTGRHTGAFLLLFLAEGDSYGGKLLQRCEDELPSNPIDSAILYRTLKQLEKDGAVESYLDTSLQDKPVKMYKITEDGKRKLEEFQKDIVDKLRNLTFFINKYEGWKETNHD